MDRVPIPGRQSGLDGGQGGSGAGDRDHGAGEDRPTDLGDHGLDVGPELREVLGAHPAHVGAEETLGQARAAELQDDIRVATSAP